MDFFLHKWQVGVKTRLVPHPIAGFHGSSSWASYTAPTFQGISSQPANFPAENAISSPVSWSPIFQTLKIQILTFHKNLTKYLDVANCIHYNHGNFQYEIPCYVG
jgi:hypothetical protein